MDGDIYISKGLCCFKCKNKLSSSNITFINRNNDKIIIHYFCNIKCLRKYINKNIVITYNDKLIKYE